MSRQRHLQRAPIVEALIDIQVEPRTGLTFAELQRGFAAADTAYYVKGPMSEGVFGFHLPADGSRATTESETTQVGLRLHSSDEKYVVQVKLGGFTLSRLAPYQNWELLRAEAERWWARYVECLDPQKINRIAVRYINNLQLPVPMGTSFGRYIDTLVEVPKSIPQDVEGFVQRFQLREEDSDARVIVTLALGSDEPSEKAPVILDIDAFANTQLAVGDRAMWKRLELLRALKNRCFFGIVSEAAVELYE